MGDEETAKNALTGLRSAEGYIRSQLARQMNLRNTPEIRFIMDQSIAYGVKMSKMIDEVNKDSSVNNDESDEDSDKGSSDQDGAIDDTGESSEQSEE